MTQDILTGIGELIEKLVRHSDSITEHGQLMKHAADKLEKLFDYIVDSETNSALRISRLEEALEAKDEFISELQEHEYRSPWSHGWVS